MKADTVVDCVWINRLSFERQLKGEHPGGDKKCKRKEEKTKNTQGSNENTKKQMRYNQGLHTREISP